MSLFNTIFTCTILLQCIKNGALSDVNNTIFDEKNNQNLSVIDIEDVNIHDFNSTTTDDEDRLFLSYRITDVPIDNNGYVSVTSPNYPKPYPENSTTIEWLVGIGEGFGVELIVRDLDLDGNSNDYVYIIPGKNRLETEDQIILSWYLKTEKKYRLLHLDELIIKFVMNTKLTPNTYKGFKIDIKRVGLMPTTIEPTTTVEPPLTIDSKQIATLYLGGRTPEQFLNVSDAFREVLAKTAELYCAEENITIAENLTVLDNVNYHLITACMIAWPDSDHCVKVNYSISVLYDNVTQEYELTTEHLNDMWSRYYDKMDLNSLGIKAYPLPNDRLTFWTWVGISLGIIVWFFIILYGIWRCRLFNEYDQPYERRDSLMFKKQSDASLYPTPHQNIPPLFMYDNFGSDEMNNEWFNYLPPKYSEDMLPSYNAKDTNSSFMVDGELFGLDSDEEIVMSLPDQFKGINMRTQEIEGSRTSESYL